MSITIKNISYNIQTKKIINDISIKVDNGEIVSIIGPNGAGKSSLIKIISGDIQPTKGAVIFNKVNLNLISIKERAKMRSVMSQSHNIVFNFLVKEVIEMGWISSEKKENNIFQECLENVAHECGIDNLLNRTFNSLSGGEKRRVHFARTLIQLYNRFDNIKSKYMLLDEPTANLDLYHEIKLMKLLQKKAKEGLGILMVLHNLNLAYKISNKIAIIHNGKLKCFDVPEKCCSNKILTHVYQTPINVNHKNKIITYY